MVQIKPGTNHEEVFSDPLYILYGSDKTENQKSKEGVQMTLYILYGSDKTNDHAPY